MSRAAQIRDQKGGGYRFNGWRLERRGRRLVDPNEKSVPLSKGEYTLLLAFLEAPGRPLTREHLLGATRVHEDIFDRSIDVQVLRLRRKLEIDPNAPRMIRTERGIGYVFALPVQRFLTISSGRSCQTGPGNRSLDAWSTDVSALLRSPFACHEYWCS